MGKVVGKKFQGDVATELEVFRFQLYPHAPATEPAEDAKMGNRLTHGLGGRGHRLRMLGGDKRKVHAIAG
jgi:hypothetical protein